MKLLRLTDEQLDQLDSIVHEYCCNSSNILDTNFEKDKQIASSLYSLIIEAEEE